MRVKLLEKEQAKLPAVSQWSASIQFQSMKHWVGIFRWMDITKAIDRVIEKRPEIVVKKLIILLAGDSKCTACLFSPHLSIKNMLLRNIVTTVRQRCQEILEMLPSSKIQLLCS